MFNAVFENAVTDAVSTVYTPANRGKIDLRLKGDLGAGTLTIVLINDTYGEIPVVLDFSQSRLINLELNRLESFRFELTGSDVATSASLYFSYYT